MNEDITLHYYEANAYEFVSRTVSLDMSALYAPFLELLPAGAHILDAGCGSGRDSLYFLKQGCRVTALDACAAFVDAGSNLIGQLVLHMRFQDVIFEEEFDGVWACASLLHVPESEIDECVGKLITALKPGGVLYASFKYGSRDEFRKGRLFSDYDESRMKRLIGRHPRTRLIQLWRTEDARSERQEERWLNVMLRRQCAASE